MQVGSVLPLLRKLLCTEDYSHYRKPLRQFDGTRKVRHAQFMILKREKEMDSWMHDREFRQRS